MVSTTSYMIGQFNLDNINILKEMNFQVHVACNFIKGIGWTVKESKNLLNKLKEEGVFCHQIDFDPSPFNISADKLAYKQLDNLFKKYNFDLMHCQTPVGGVIARQVAKKYRTKVIYVAHGFHFFKGAPKKNWLLYYPVEKHMSHYTDLLVTINNEDNSLAKRKFKAKKIEKINGAGVNTKKFSRDLARRKKTRSDFNIPDEKVVLLSVGELNNNKNHETVIKAISKIDHKNLFYVIAGIGEKRAYLQNLINKLKLQNVVKLAGYRNDIENLYSMADIFVFPSQREGLSSAGVEAMSAGLPIIGSNVRGIKDFMVDGKSGYLVSPLNVNAFAQKITLLEKDQSKRLQMGTYNKETAKKFDISNVHNQMKKVYEGINLNN